METIDHNISSTDARLRTIDLLRGLAILGVIAVHTSQTIPTQSSLINHFFSFGAYGVQLFYLLSAITMCLMWQKRSGDPHPIKNFYIRRFLRIAPLFWLAIPVYISINGFGPSYWAPEGIGDRQIILTALFLHGVYPDSINSVVPGGWSIAIEMTFYLVFPILIIFFKNNARLYLLSAIGLWLINTLLLKEWLLHYFLRNSPFTQAYINEFLNLYFINQAPVFLVGCWLYFSLLNNVKKIDLVIFGLWMIFATLLKVFFLYGGLGFLTIFLFLSAFSYVCFQKQIEFMPLELLGKNSYAIYLTHFLIISFVYRLIPIKTGLLGFLKGMTLTVILSFLISLLIHLLIEKPFQRWAEKLTQDPSARSQK